MKGDAADARCIPATWAYAADLALLFPRFPTQFLIQNRWTKRPTLRHASTVQRAASSSGRGVCFCAECRAQRK